MADWPVSSRPDQLTNVQLSVVGRREADERLNSAQTALMLQEEAIRRSERDRQQLADKISSLERSLASADKEKRSLQVLISK